MEHYKAPHHTHSKLGRNRAITEWRKRDRETEIQGKRDIMEQYKASHHTHSMLERDRAIKEQSKRER